MILDNEDWKNYDVYVRNDDSYVITYKNYPYHVPNEGEWSELWSEVNEWVNEHPDKLLHETIPSEEETLEEVKINARNQIDLETSKAITSGFDYEIDSGDGTLELLHFSYDMYDQQNFADTANVAILSISMSQNVESMSIPTSVTWNAYRNYTVETGGELVRLNLNARSFLELYTNGALVHKATQMELGGQRKAAVEEAKTIEEVESILYKK